MLHVIYKYVYRHILYVSVRVLSHQGHLIQSTYIKGLVVLGVFLYCMYIYFFIIKKKTLRNPNTRENVETSDV